MKKHLPLLILSFFLTGLFGQNVEFTPVSLTGSPPLDDITDITGSGDGSGKLYIVQKNGVIRIVENGVIASQNFLSITNLADDSNSETGLLGLAFHPQWPDSNYIYVNYVKEGTITTRISRFTVPGPNYDNADENSNLELIEVPGIQPNHKAGDLAFGPDGYLYITMGDGGGGGDPQDTGQDFDRMLGKILRIDVNSFENGENYAIPPDNPYANYTGAGDTLPEIWMNGVRNPWRISFDRETGDLWIADVGQNLYEEVNMIPAGTGAGLNLGWDCREGFHNFSPSHCDTTVMPLTYPVLEYPHACTEPCLNGNSVTGGFVYRGSQYPDMYGLYVGVDYVFNDVFRIEQTGSNSFTITFHSADGNSNISTFGEADNGELYAGNLAGTLYTVSMGAPLPIQWENLMALPLSNGNKVQWTLHNSTDVDYFEIQRSSLIEFIHITSVAEIEPEPGEITYSYHDPYLSHDGVYYRVAAHMMDGTIEYSPIGRILPNPISKPSLTFDLHTGMWRVVLPDYWQKGYVTLYDIQGRTVFHKQLPEKEHMDLAAPVTPGVYFIVIRGNEGTWSDKLIR